MNKIYAIKHYQADLYGSYYEKNIIAFSSKEKAIEFANKLTDIAHGLNNKVNNEPNMYGLDGDFNGDKYRILLKEYLVQLPADMSELIVKYDIQIRSGHPFYVDEIDMLD
jgi:hypothetical protein